LIISTQLGWEGAALDALFLAAGLVEADFLVAVDIAMNIVEVGWCWKWVDVGERRRNGREAADGGGGG
jgi:hypothetical protein